MSDKKDSEKINEAYEEGVKASKTFNQANAVDRILGSPGHVDKTGWSQEEKEAYEDGKRDNGNKE